MTSRREKHKERELQSAAAVVVVSSRKYSVDRRGARDISRIIEAFKKTFLFSFCDFMLIKVWSFKLHKRGNL